MNVHLCVYVCEWVQLHQFNCLMHASLYGNFKCFFPFFFFAYIYRLSHLSIFSYLCIYLNLLVTVFVSLEETDAYRRQFIFYRVQSLESVLWRCVGNEFYFVLINTFAELRQNMRRATEWNERDQITKWKGHRICCRFHSN